jgi:GcrA cell cycle regulator
MRGGPYSWTDERIALLRKLWAEGATASAIAARLGCARAGVLGKIHRLRLGGSSVVAPSIERKSAEPNSAAADERVSHDLLPSPARRRCGKQGDQSGSPHAKAKAPGKRLPELTNESCRWPLGHPGTARFLFCGVPEANLELGIPYCRRHLRRAYLVPRRARQKIKPGVVPAGDLPSAASNMTASRTNLWRARVRNPAARWR